MPFINARLIASSIVSVLFSSHTSYIKSPLKTKLRGRRVWPAFKGLCLGNLTSTVLMKKFKLAVEHRFKSGKRTDIWHEARHRMYSKGKKKNVEINRKIQVFYNNIFNYIYLEHKLTN